VTEKFPDSHLIPLVLSALKLREKKPDEAKQILQEFRSSDNRNQATVEVSIAQIELNSGNIKGAIRTLESIPQIQHKPATVSTLVSLYQSINSPSASAVLSRATSYWRDLLKKSPQEERDEVERTYKKLGWEYGLFLLRDKKPKEAASLFLSLYNSFPTHTSFLVYLVIALSQSNPQEAQKYSQQLPAIGKANFDAEALENLPLATRSGGGTKPKSEDPLLPVSGEENPLTRKQKDKAKSSDGSLKKKAKQNNKKKKKKQPKNFDPNVTPDPERWVPKRERSAFKRRLAKKGQSLRGAQGERTAGQNETTLTTSTSNTITNKQIPKQDTKTQQQTQKSPTQQQKSSKQTQPQTQPQTNAPQQKQQQRKKGEKKGGRRRR